MIDFGFDKLALIGAVALIVIGPEKLPKVARTVGHLGLSPGLFVALPLMVVLRGGVFLMAMLWLSVRHYNWSWRFLWPTRAPQNKGAA